MRSTVLLALLLALLAGCGGEEEKGFPASSVRSAFDRQGFALAGSTITLDDDRTAVWLESPRHEVDVVVFGSSGQADAHAGELFQPVGWGTLEQPRPMLRAENVVVFSDRAFTDRPVEDRIRAAIRSLEEA
jgi:hypothetical protein